MVKKSGGRLVISQYEELFLAQERRIRELEFQVSELMSDGGREVGPESYVLVERFWGNTLFDPDEGVVRSEKGSAVSLTNAESHILDLLVRYKGKVIDVGALYRVVTDDANESLTDEVEVIRPHISNLRSKLSEVSPLLSQHLVNVRGRGYKWQEM